MKEGVFLPKFNLGNELC